MPAVGETREPIRARATTDFLDLPHVLQRSARDRREQADIPRLVTGDLIRLAALYHDRADRSVRPEDRHDRQRSDRATLAAVRTLLGRRPRGVLEDQRQSSPTSDSRVT
jgi:hypothetical protein